MAGCDMVKMSVENKLWRCKKVYELQILGHPKGDVRARKNSRSVSAHLFLTRTCYLLLSSWTLSHVAILPFFLLATVYYLVVNKLCMFNSFILTCYYRQVTTGSKSLFSSAMVHLILIPPHLYKTGFFLGFITKEGEDCYWHSRLPSGFSFLLIRAQIFSVSFFHWIILRKVSWTFHLMGIKNKQTKEAKRGSPYTVVVNMLDFTIMSSNSSHSDIHFWTPTLWERYEPPINPQLWIK